MVGFNLIDHCINLFQKLVSDQVFNRKTINYSLLPDPTIHGWNSKFFMTVYFHLHTHTFYYVMLLQQKERILFRDASPEQIGIKENNKRKG